MNEKTLIDAVAAINKIPKQERQMTELMTAVNRQLNTQVSSQDESSQAYLKLAKSDQLANIKALRFKEVVLSNTTSGDDTVIYVDQPIYSVACSIKVTLYDNIFKLIAASLLTVVLVRTGFQVQQQRHNR